MATEFVAQRYVREGAIERRDYQVALADQAKKDNCIVVLPTGLGKTAVAAQVIAEYLARGDGGALFLAPTRVLANQHYRFLQGALTVEDISLVTGEDSAPKRQKMWGGSSVVCATPEIVRNDLDRGAVSASQFSLAVFDEAHRAVGDYAYTKIADAMAAAGARIVGMTATLPSEHAKAKAIMASLRASGVAQRTEQSGDVKPYIQTTKVEGIKVALPREMEDIRALLNKALDYRYGALARHGFGLGSRRSLSALLGIRGAVISQRRGAAKPLFEAIRTTYALNMLEAHGITTFLRFCERTTKRGGAPAKALFEQDERVSRAVRLAREAQSRGLEHPKIPKLVEILRENAGGRTLVFSSYRDSVDVIRASLEEAGIGAAILIGKAGEEGLKQKKQVETVERFRAGEYQALVSTRVGEEGLDISEVNLVVFYDNVPSSIRHVQRRGRTGRRDAGRLVVLIAEKTIDEAYYWIGHRKIKAAGRMGEKLNMEVGSEGARAAAEAEEGARAALEGGGSAGGGKAGSKAGGGGDVLDDYL